ncbi:RNA-directed DNA polymerase, eukaryota [Tanacetum coccineum]
MLGSIDCMHWDWKNCPKALHGQFKRKDHKYPTLMLEAVVDQKLWIWHAYFGVSRANNDLNVLYGSPLFDDVLSDTAPEAPFVVNGRTYMKSYYLADDIYPTWSLSVKAFSIARDEKKNLEVQKSSRKCKKRYRTSFWSSTRFHYDVLERMQRFFLSVISNNGILKSCDDC